MKGFILPARGKNILLVLLGNALYALAVDMFVLPCGLITGGTTGLALAARYWFDVPVAGFVLASNIVMFAVGALAMAWLASVLSVVFFAGPEVTVIPFSAETKEGREEIYAQMERSIQRGEE